MSEAGRLWGFDGTNRYAHGGMLTAALHIRQELEQSKALSKLFGAHRTSSNITTPLTEVSFVALGCIVLFQVVFALAEWKLCSL